MLVFQNPGEIDIRAVTTLGVSVKEGTSPIGYFGTGLKYAIATILRNGGSVQIFSGKTSYAFSVFQTSIRGQEFGLVSMSQDGAPAKELGFTTELGRNWTLRNAYRELWSNCRDEQGDIMETPTARPRHGWTSICVTGLESAHESRKEFLLIDRKLLAQNACIDILDGKSSYVFYRGIAAMKLPVNSAVTYNIIQTCTLTEDRTFQDIWYVEHLIKNTILALQDELFEQAVATPASYEQQLNFTSLSDITPKLAALEKIIKSSPDSLNKTLLSFFLTRPRAKPLSFEEIPLTDAYRIMIGEAHARLDKLSFFNFTTYPIKLSPNLGTDILAQAIDKTIWLTPAVFATQQLLTHAILEEYIHLQTGYGDNTREMQNFLFNQLVTLVLE